MSQSSTIQAPVVQPAPMGASPDTTPSPAKLDLEPLAKAAVTVAAGIVSNFSNLGGIVLAWAGELAFEIYDLEKSGAEPIAVAQLAGDRTATLIERLKVG